MSVARFEDKALWDGWGMLRTDPESHILTCTELKTLVSLLIGKVNYWRKFSSAINRSLPTLVKYIYNRVSNLKQCD